LWPVHLKPKPDELLSSWLVRLALTNSLSPNAFYSLIVPGKTALPTNIDVTKDRGFLWFLVRKTGAQINLVSATTLLEFQAYFAQYQNLGSTCPPRITHQWILPTNYFSDVPPLFGLQFCPLCLLEVPYFRRAWRLAFITLCERHHVLLLDRCTQCGSPINVLKSSYKRGRVLSVSDITKCYSCNFNIIHAIPTPIPRNLPQDEFVLQGQLVKIIKEGSILRLKGKSIDIPLYFSRLHDLVRVLAFGELGETLRKGVSKRYKLPMFSVSQPTKPRCVELLSIRERLGLIGMAMRLIQEWPHDLFSI
jgi:hypothetical protein